MKSYPYLFTKKRIISSCWKCTQVSGILVSLYTILLQAYRGLHFCSGSGKLSLQFGGTLMMKYYGHRGWKKSHSIKSPDSSLRSIKMILFYSLSKCFIMPLRLFPWADIIIRHPFLIWGTITLFQYGSVLCIVIFNDSCVGNSHSEGPST